MFDPSRLNWLYTHRLSEALVRQGCDVHLITSRFLYLDHVEDGVYQKIEHFYTRTTRLYGGKPRGLLRRYVKGAEHVIDMVRLPSLLKTLTPDIIHYQQSPLPMVDRWFLGRLNRIAPLVSTVHNTTPFHGDAGAFQKGGFGNFLSRFDHLIVNTQYSLQQLTEEIGIPEDRISVVPGGLYDHYEGVADPDTANLAGQKTDGIQNILFFGSISAYKGLDTLIRAFAELPMEQHRNTRLLVCGNPQMPMEPIKDLAHTLMVDDRIEWDLRFIPEEQIHGIFARASVLALPYRHIDRSGVLAAAVRYGKPIVASRVGGFAEVLTDGVHGHLVTPDDPPAFAKALDSVLSNATKAAEMTKGVLDLSKSWKSWDEVAEETVGIYKSVSNRQI